MSPIGPLPDEAAPPEIESPVFRQASRTINQVRQPDSPWTVAAGATFALVLGAIVFTSLSAGRQARADTNATSPAPAKPAAAPAPPPPKPAPPAAPLPAPPPVVAAVPAQPDPALSLRAPVMVVDQSEPSPAAAVAGAPSGHAADPPAAESGSSAEERFEARVTSGGVETSHATQLGDLTRVMPQGTVIPAVLETAIDSDLPGSVRAVVSQDVRGFDGTQVLVPRGSKLIGQYRSGMALGQTRAFVVWSRILTPEGVSIDVGSPGTDPLGRGGLSGETDTHFFERFGGAILLSVLSIGLETALERETNTAIIIGSPAQATPLPSGGTQTPSIPVTIKVKQGAPLQVFLVRDLDFSGVAAAKP
jgi:type IV secretory pathway VirB10-like protein